MRESSRESDLMQVKLTQVLLEGMDKQEGEHPESITPTLPLLGKHR